ncbi:glucuronate isomerase [Adhaeribacter pallidiroseus]|uniref:Uronate isomerase n=1 Tax=Adhaeribacter pallidiroseus TaxID=2072847 RepID=A0A369QDG0_9BACT|nr:glucuronate isomerase [Adhaeribacter pallidiroseus]RDC61595.1 Glucuronate isomerase [Adhaeribacter pallidiroseus]
MYNKEDTLITYAARTMAKLPTSGSFLTPEFLLENKTASWLYHEVAAGLPIIDYHNHLNPHHLAENQNFKNLTQLWITHDPYKHRAMRINGIPEKYITGQSTDKEKFFKWAETLPNTLGNPLYHWSGLELKTVLGIDKLLNPDTAEEVWNTGNEQLKSTEFGTLAILKKFNAEFTCTSDDLLDDVTLHQVATCKADGLTILPSLRADSIGNVGQPAFTNWVNKLAIRCNSEINSLQTYQDAVRMRLAAFDTAGCLLADHALNAGFCFKLPTVAKAEDLFQKVLRGNNLNSEEKVLLQSYLLVFLGQEYRQRGWAMQLHIGAQRATSTRLRKLAGPAGGYATIGKSVDISSLCGFLDALDSHNNLPKVILYTLNPADNDALAALTGSFSEDGVKAKVQFGPAWWYNDHLTGIENQLISMASYGLLPHFIGMTTDSRSVLSFTRHHYFRRILCNLIGQWAETGRIPADKSILEELIRNISYHNAKNWLIKTK